ncbi:MAG: glycosyltransferase family 39 protein [Planctomycetaceae bacterium]|nr:glycosyltransferase family 39 protein [Planctomycetaceae bacterium]
MKTKTFLKSDNTIKPISDFSSTQAAIWFWSMVGFFSVFWIIFPTLFHSSYRMTDVVELQCVAREWVLSTRKHPMLPAWILEIVNIITNRTFAAPFIASQICVIISLWSVWQLGRKILSEKLALIGALSALPYYFFGYHSLVYNQNMTLIAFWSLSIYLVFQAYAEAVLKSKNLNTQAQQRGAVVQGRSLPPIPAPVYQTNRILYWVLSGLSIGIAFHAKYPAAILVFSILIFMFTRAEGRKCWCGISITAIVAAVIFLPHLVWLYQNDFATLDYVSNRHVYSNPIFRLTMPLLFIFYQAEYWLPIVIVLCPVLGFIWRWRFAAANNEARKTCEKYLFYCIAINTLVWAIICAIKNCWIPAAYGAPSWVFFGTWLLLRFQTNEFPNTFFRTIKLVVLLEFMMGLLLICSVLMPYLDGKQRKQLFPSREIGAACDKIWYSKVNTPCPFVSGEWSICGYACWMMRDRPRLHYYWNIYDGDIACPTSKPTGTWATDEDFNQKGGIIIWNIPDNCEPTTYVPDWLHRRFPNAEIITEPIILPYKTKAKVPPLKAGVAIVIPK